MKRFPLLVVASAVAAALAAPVTLAQTSGGDAPRGTDRNAAGGTGAPSSPSGTMPSTQPGTPADRMGDRSTGTPGTAGARPSETSPTDGRTGGTGPNSGSTSTTKPSTSGDRMGDRSTGGTGSAGTAGARPSERSATDGRTGGTGPNSGSSATTPSTSGDGMGTRGMTPPDRMGDRNTGSMGSAGTAGARASERSPTDGRTGGTGPNSGSSATTTGDRMGMGQTSSRGAMMNGQGTHGAETVRGVQQSLQDKGFDVGPIDGVMGPRTQAALREFQQRQGIQGTGLNQETMSALDVRARSGG